MRKALLGICAAIIIVATGAYFGSELWAQFRTKNEVDAVFDSLRTTFPTATHGKVELYYKTRSVKISDINLQTGDRSTTIKIGQIIAVGTKGPVGGRVSAGRIEITDWEFATTIPIAAGPTLTYKAPSIVIEAFSGPSNFPIKVNPASGIDITRGSLEYLAASAAKAMTIPKLSVNIAPSRSSEPTPALAPIEYTYTDIVFREIRNRKIAEIATERITFTSEMVAPDLGSFAGAMAHFSVADFNIDAPIAILDPAKAKDDSYIPLYGKASVGPVEFRFSKGSAMQIEGFSFDGIAIRPSKLALANLIAIADASPKTGAQPTPEQLRDMLDKLAGLYEGFRFGKMEMRGIRTDVPPNSVVKLGAIRLTGFENGRLTEFAIEGLDGVSKQTDPVRIGRFALKGLQISKLIRYSAELAQSGHAPSLDQSLAMFSMLEGIELNDVTGKSPLTQEPVRIETFQFSWGKFVGPIPTTVRLTAKMTVPSSLADPGMGGMLSDAGMPNVTTNMDIGLAWDEGNKTLVLAPGTIELENAFTFSAKFSIFNVPRELFSLDIIQAMGAVNMTEVGPLEITLHDTGAVKKALEQYAKTKNLSPEEARKQVTESVMENAKAGAEKNPDVTLVAQAIVQFIETPGSTLSIKVTPKSRMTVNQIFGASAADPNAAFTMFSIEAKTTQ